MASFFKIRKERTIIASKNKSSKAKKPKAKYPLWVKIIKFFMPYFEPKKAPIIVEPKKKKEENTSKKDVVEKKSKDKSLSDVDKEIFDALGGTLDLGLDDRIDDSEKYMIDEDDEDQQNKEESDEQESKETQSRDDKISKDKSQTSDSSEERSQKKDHSQERQLKEDVGSKSDKIDREREKQLDKERIERAKQERIKAHEEKASYPKKPLRSEADKLSKQVKNKKENVSQINISSAKSVRNEFDIPVRETLNNDNPKLSLADEKLLMPVLNYPKPLDNVMNFKNKPKLNKIWCYHDEKRHQVIGHFAPGTGYACTTRNDEKRWTLEPWVKARAKKELHRTHLIPIGYHGSEADPRLVIMWDGEANTGVFKQFEAKQKRRNEPIYWFVDVRKTKYGATWKYSVYSAKTLKQLDVLVYEMKGKFMWRK